MFIMWVLEILTFNYFVNAHMYVYNALCEDLVSLVDGFIFVRIQN